MSASFLVKTMFAKGLVEVHTATGLLVWEAIVEVTAVNRKTNVLPLLKESIANNGSVSCCSPTAS